MTMLTNLCQWLRKRKIELYLYEVTAENSHTEIVEQLELSTAGINCIKSIDLVITLGGDGTFIGIARELEGGPPILGVNWGRLGFITEFSAQELYSHLEQVLKGQYKTYQMHLLSSTHFSKDHKVISERSFVNDIVISKNNIARMFPLRIECDGETMTSISGDGLIVSSPIGSTAYSLAAGGPIVHPLIEGMLLTPICPHSLLHRPVIISNKSKITIQLERHEPAIVMTIDGQETLELEYGEYITVSKSKNLPLNIIKNNTKNYFHTIKSKFLNHKD